MRKTEEKTLSLFTSSSASKLDNSECALSGFIDLKNHIAAYSLYGEVTVKFEDEQVQALWEIKSHVDERKRKKEHLVKEAKERASIIVRDARIEAQEIINQAKNSTVIDVATVNA